jgi:hypothetical protein
MHAVRDPDYRKPPVSTYAQHLRELFANTTDPRQTVLVPDRNPPDTETGSEPAQVDALETAKAAAIQALRADAQTMSKLNGPDGAPWGGIKAALLEHLSERLDDRDNIAFRLVKTAMDRIFGPQGDAWESYKHPVREKTYVRRIIRP